MSENTERPASENDGTQAIRRAAAMLQRIARVTTGVSPTLGDISASMGLSRSTTHRILKSLVDTGLAVYDADSRRYGIGMLAFELGLAVTDPLSGVGQWQLAVERIARRTQATTYLMRRSGMEAVCVFKADGTSLVRVMPVTVGQRRLLGVGAGATALLAALDDAAVDQMIAAMTAELRQLGTRTPEQLREDVAATRRAGYATSLGKVYQAVVGLGMVVPGSGEPPEYAVSIAAHETDASPANMARWTAILHEELGRRDATAA
jgi:DNA-binding IclR family transcriptional regulator